MVPSLFLAHGSPMIAIEDTEYTRFLADCARKLKPRAIVIFTAHWESDVLTVTYRDDAYETIHDFGGFPPELYAIQYPAKGSKQIAGMLEERFAKNGIAVQKDAARGLDHGSWTLLRRMYPAADIPVVQVSVNPFLSLNEQYKIGESLQGFGEEHILLIGSGATFHNFRTLNWGERNGSPAKEAVEFDDWLIDKLQSRDLAALFQYEKLAPHARLAVPRAEHFVPLLIAMGSGDPKSKAQVIHRSYEYGTLSYLSLRF